VAVLIIESDEEVSMKKLLTVLLVLLLPVSFALAGSGTQKSSGGTKIGVSIMELTAYTWYLGVIDGCNQWAKEHPEANVSFQFEDSKSDVSTMMNNIDNLITAGSKGIILFPADASSAIPVIKQYTANGIPFVIGDYAQQPNSQADVVWKTFVGHDMTALGEIAGKVAVDYLKTLGKDNPVCLFVTRPQSGQVTIDRLEGFRKVVLASFPKARIISEGDTGAGSRASAQDLVENILQRERVIDVVSGHNDAAVIGAYNAAVSQNRTSIKFVGIAGDKDVLGYITNGNPAWIGEVLQDPVVLGHTAMEAMWQSMQGKTLPPKFDLPQPEAITPANIKSYNWQSWSWL
jgi:ABC-type sugar transport system substrate-binding protein